MQLKIHISTGWQSWWQEFRCLQLPSVRSSSFSCLQNKLCSPRWIFRTWSTYKKFNRFLSLNVSVLNI